ncbi:MAG: type IV secretory system conjugative DNA transfer family protein [Streptosporangiaceae bacterium]
MFLGRAHYRHRLHVPLEEHLLVMAPPRTYKTAFLADVILRYPGSIIATTTKPDIYALTSAVRAGLGPVHVFNPQYIGGVPSTFCWSPIGGCQDLATAIRRADAFAFAVSQKGVEDGSFWSAKASDYLRGYFHTAALARYDLRAAAAVPSRRDMKTSRRSNRSPLSSRAIPALSPRRRMRAKLPGYVYPDVTARRAQGGADAQVRPHPR